jgi:hypothetical protein
MGTITDGREERWVRILLGLLCAGALVPVWIAPLLPLQDVPNHLLKADLLQRWMRGENWDAPIYALNLGLLPNYSLYAGLLSLAPLFGLMTAAKILLSLIVVGLPWSAYAFLRRVNPANTLFALAVPAINFTLFLMMGSLNFCLALAVYLCALVFFVSERPPAWRASLGFAAVATALYFTHGFVFLALVGTVVCLVVLDYRREWMLRAAGLLPGIVGFALTVAESFKLGAPASASVRPFFAGVGWHSLRNALVWLLNPHGWGYDTPFALAWVGLLGVCYLAALAGAFRLRRDRSSLVESLRENAWLIIGTLLMVAFFITPVQVGEWTHARPRFVPLAVLSLLGAFRLPGKPALRLSVMILFTFTALAIEARNTQEFLKRSAQVQEFISGIDAVEAGSAMLPVVSPEAGPKYSVNLHAWAYYAMAHGGWSPYLHAETTHNPVIYRVIPWAPGEEAGLRGGDLALRRIAACYDYVLVWNTKPGDAALLRPFFSVVRATTHLHVWRNRLGARKGTPSSNPACASEQRAAARSSTQ